ncbi:MAG: tetratricopeptide repeat protein, partial [Rhodospirillales bacterium]
MRLIRGASLLVMAWAATAAQPARAQTPDCADAALPAAMRVFACTQAITQGETDPEKFADLFINRADALIDEGFPDKALSDLNSAVRLTPRRKRVHFLRARINHTAGRDAVALTDADAGLTLDPRNAHALALRARILSALGRFADAAESASRALDTNPHHVAALVQRGAAQMAQGRYQLARADLNAAVVLAPENGE